MALLRAAHVVLGDGIAVVRLVLGLSVGEQQSELVARQARPGAYGAGIDVHERRSRRRVVAHAADLADQCGIAHLLQGHVGKHGVDRLARDVLALLGLSADSAAEHLVRLLRAIAADDVDRNLAAEFGVHLPEEIDGPRIHLGRLVLAPVAQEPVELLQGFGVVLAVLLVGDGDGLIRVDVMHRDRARVAERGDNLRRARAHPQQCGSQAREEPTFTRYQCAPRVLTDARGPLGLASVPQCDRHSRFPQG